MTPAPEILTSTRGPGCDADRRHGGRRRPWTWRRILAAQFARALRRRSALSSERAQGRPGAGRHPRSAARMHTRKKTAQQHTGVAEHTAFPARWSDGLCRALPGADSPSGLPRRSGNHRRPHRLARPPHPRGLDRSLDGQDHTVLPYARLAFPRLPARRRCARCRHPDPRDEPVSAVRPRAATGSPGTTLPARTSLARRCRVHRIPGSRS